MTVHTPESIRALRLRAGLTQEGLAQALGVTHSAVQKWELGTRIPVGLSLRALANFEDWLRQQGR